MAFSGSLQGNLWGAGGKPWGEGIWKAGGGAAGRSKVRESQRGLETLWGEGGCDNNWGCHPGVWLWLQVVASGRAPSTLSINAGISFNVPCCGRMPSGSHCMTLPGILWCFSDVLGSAGCLQVLYNPSFCLCSVLNPASIYNTQLVL